jgi:protein-S-isoprenylcysteine O-methyltransferase Ste14
MHIFNYLSILFAISEISLFLFKRAKTESGTREADKRSMGLLWLAIAGSLTVAGFISGYGIGPVINNNIFAETGLALAVVGFIIRWIAIVQLGKLFTVDVAISNTHTLKTAGLYKIVRHPSYLGLLLIIAGLAFGMENLLSLIIVLVPTFIAMNYRIIVEEKALTNQFGEQYIEYSKKVSKIIPWLY